MAPIAYGWFWALEHGADINAWYSLVHPPTLFALAILFITSEIWGRRKWSNYDRRKRLELENRCAVVLQAVARTRAEMAAHTQRRLCLAAALVVQARWRCHLQRQHFKYLIVEHKRRQEGARTLQAVCRTAAARAAFRAECFARRQERAAVRIQTSWRAKLTRRWYVDCHMSISYQDRHMLSVSSSRGSSTRTSNTTCWSSQMPAWARKPAAMAADV